MRLTGRLPFLHLFFKVHAAESGLHAPKGMADQSDILELVILTNGSLGSLCENKHVVTPVCSGIIMRQILF